MIALLSNNTNLDLKLGVVTFTQNFFVCKRKESNLVQCLTKLSKFSINIKPQSNFRSNDLIAKRIITNKLTSEALEINSLKKISLLL